MWGLVDSEQVAQQEFARALNKANMRGFWGRLLHQDTRLLVFQDILNCLPAYGRVDILRQIVPIQQIIGTAGRVNDFDNQFLPRAGAAAQRWKNVHKAYSRGESLPPISLYKVGKLYFVEDGHHRISVARLQGQDFIEAEVKEMAGGSAITSIDDLLKACACKKPCHCTPRTLHEAEIC